ncbi:hypothetical protein M758_4G069700 [Ceratodon purpureus]|nr:hypothetical protein M758_4G069700 [Ceratodon purpureus]
MGSLAMMEVVQVVSMAGLGGSGASLGSCSTSSSSFSSGLMVRGSDLRRSNRGVGVNGVRASMVHVQSGEDSRRSVFGRGSVSLRASTRLDVRAQATKQTFSSFDDMLQNCGIPVLVDFYAVWCGPCQMMVPILNEVSSALQDKVRVVKIDTEKYPDLASRFNIQALPTLVLFKNGQVADRIEGVLRSEELVNRIQKVL